MKPNKTLIINLSDDSSILTTQYLLNRNKGLGEVTILTFQENRKATEVLSVDNRVYIDRKKIQNLFKNNIFSKSIAINELISDLNIVLKSKWTNVINFSNNETSNLLTTLLKLELPNIEVTGVHFGDDNEKIYPNKSTILFDEFQNSQSSPFTQQELLVKLLDVNFTDHKEPELVPSGEYLSSVKSSFERIRENQRVYDREVKIAGIQIFSELASDSFDKDIILNLVDNILDRNDLFPILIISHSKEQRAFAKDINERLNNSLVIIEASYQALSAVVSNLDLLITPKSATKHLADLVKTSTIEVSFNKDNLFKQPSIRNNNILIHTNQLKAVDAIMNAIEFKISGTNNFGSSHEVYQVQNVNNNVIYLPLSNNYISQAKYLLREYKKIALNPELGVPDLKCVNKELLKEYFEEEKICAMNILKDVLSLLRSIKEFKNTRRSQRFIESTDKIFEHINEETMFSPILTLFKNKLENLKTNNVTDSIALIEQYTYDLKNEIQLILNNIKGIDIQDKNEVKESTL